MIYIRDTETKMAELRLDKELKQRDVAEFLKIETYRYSQLKRDICNNLSNFYDVSLDFFRDGRL